MYIRTEAYRKKLFGAGREAKGANSRGKSRKIGDKEKTVTKRRDKVKAEKKSKQVGKNKKY